MNFPKKCNCCGRIYRQYSWAALPYKGEQADEYETLEMRDCICGSTLAIVTKVHKVDPETLPYVVP